MNPEGELSDQKFTESKDKPTQNLESRQLPVNSKTLSELAPGDLIYSFGNSYTVNEVSFENSGNPDMVCVITSPSTVFTIYNTPNGFLAKDEHKMNLSFSQGSSYIRKAKTES